MKLFVVSTLLVVVMGATVLGHHGHMGGGMGGMHGGMGGMHGRPGWHHGGGGGTVLNMIINLIA